jgi:hypothetical protein
MPCYHFKIRQGEKTNSPAQLLDLPDDRSAQREAALLCRDYSRDVVSDFETNPEWCDGRSRKALFRFWFLAETL